MGKKKWHRHRKKPYVRPARRTTTLSNDFLSRIPDIDVDYNPYSTNGTSSTEASTPMPVYIDTAGSQSGLSDDSINTHSSFRIVDSDVNINSLEISAEGMIESNNIEMSRDYEPSQTLTSAIQNLDNRIISLEAPDLYDPNYMISNGNALDLSNALKNLSLEGYTEIELTNVLRDLMNRTRDGET